MKQPNKIATLRVLIKHIFSFCVFYKVDIARLSFNLLTFEIQK